MNKPNFIKSVETVINKRGPEILAGIGIAGMISSIALTAKIAPKVSRLMEQAEQEKGEELTVKEKFKIAWKPCLPIAVTTVTSTACLIGASSVNAKRNAALATAYQLTSNAFAEYKEQVVETIGEKKEKTIKEKVADKKLAKDPVTTKEVIITERGNTLCYDAISGRYFKSDMDIIKKAENLLNRRLINEMYISLNEFYDELGLKPTRQGDDLGWNMDDGYISLDLSSHLADDGTPCLVVDYSVAPRYDFSKLM